MFSLSQCIYEEGFDDGKEKGLEQGLEQGLEKGLEQGIQYLINVVEEFGGTMEMAVQQLMVKYGLEEMNALEKVKRYW